MGVCSRVYLLSMKWLKNSCKWVENHKIWSAVAAGLITVVIISLFGAIPWKDIGHIILYILNSKFHLWVMLAVIGAFFLIYKFFKKQKREILSDNIFLNNGLSSRQVEIISILSKCIGIGCLLNELVESISIDPIIAKNEINGLVDKKIVSVVINLNSPSKYVLTIDGEKIAAQYQKKGDKVLANIIQGSHIESSDNLTDTLSESGELDKIDRCCLKVISDLSPDEIEFNELNKEIPFLKALVEASLIKLENIELIERIYYEQIGDCYKLTNKGKTFFAKLLAD